MTKKILITDDALFMRTTLKDILLEEGYCVHEATNGKEAIEAFNAHRPDLILMDITMPVMDGVTAIKLILQQDPRARVIVCCAMGQKNLVLEAIQAGAKDFILKPFQPDRILEGVHSLIGPSMAEEDRVAA